MEDYGLVSIITPTYNCGKFISETIESVLSQTYKNWELIISDDCSTDNTEEIIKPYLERDSRIKYICNEHNSGAAITRNAAIRKANGKWIAFLDSDDLWLPEKLERQLKFMAENNYHFSCTESISFDEDANIAENKEIKPKHITKLGLKLYCWVGCLSAMYDSEVTGLIQIADIKKNNDYAIWLKVIKNCDCYSLPEALTLYRVRTSSISHVGSKTKLIKHHYKLWRESENVSVLGSCILTGLNLIFGTIKKTLYKKKLTEEERESALSLLQNVK